MLLIQQDYGFLYVYENWQQLSCRAVRISKHNCMISMLSSIVIYLIKHHDTNITSYAEFVLFTMNPINYNGCLSRHFCPCYQYKEHCQITGHRSRNLETFITWNIQLAAKSK